ncbi:MAG: prepilin signal peptidase PulO-like peptidase [Mycobacterium sp.]|nr:prepilin signal peptidase PulO-like peptidase [Mycobacterium sp.]
MVARGTAVRADADSVILSYAPALPAAVATTGTQRALVAAVCAVLGLAIGSFLNVVVHRVPLGESVVHPRSRCPGCETAIAPRDNVPVLSWLLLRGRCRQCAEPISLRYPLVELACAVLFAVLAFRFGRATTDLAALPAYLYLAAVGLALALIDLAVYKLPNVLTLPSYVVGSLLLLPAALAGPGLSAWVRGLLGMAVLYALYFVLWFVSGGRGMGFGDVKLAGVLGLYLGYLGWGVLAVGTVGGFVAGAIGGLLLVWRRRGGLRQHIPYGPWMILGALVAVFAGQAISDAYVRAMFGV